ncbi:hypothetical protein [Oceanidesulfovibrio marinus]|uniref:Uncharacterized protein n=1 Tax=Oceanidesulfovibrio marinus TaxID=370038 RepID=A0ABX6NJ72_9BACT|nr:hypothetical protein [Oceanidesulfovibrio marinus]QJT10179.1 hypothetical protein E8L03_15120 [Oceanidesulfovibrio marinus]
MYNTILLQQLIQNAFPVRFSRASGDAKPATSLVFVDDLLSLSILFDIEESGRFSTALSHALFFKTAGMPHASDGVRENAALPTTGDDL